MRNSKKNSEKWLKDLHKYLNGPEKQFLKHFKVYKVQKKIFKAQKNF